MCWNPSGTLLQCKPARRRRRTVAAARDRVWNIPLDDERELALARLKKLCGAGNFSVLDFRRGRVSMLVP